MSQPDLTNPTPWSHAPQELFDALQSSPQGLSSASAQEHLEQFGPNLLQDREKANALWLFINQFKSLLVQILTLLSHLIYMDIKYDV
jgi:Ca2+-transporting ATPase